MERPLRLAAQFTPERIANLRFISGLEEPMQWAYEQWGDRLYDHLKDHEKEIKAYLEKEEITVTPKNLKVLLDPQKWKAQRDLMELAEKLAIAMGDEIWQDFNVFSSLDYSPTAQTLMAETPQKTHCFLGESPDQLLSKPFRDFPKLS